MSNRGRFLKRNILIVMVTVIMFGGLGVLAASTIFSSKNIKYNGTLIGLPNEVYTLKPAKNSNFRISDEVEDVFKQPQNIFEEMQELMNTISRNLHAKRGE